MKISEILKDKENLELLIQKFPDLQMGTLRNRYHSSKVCCNAYELVHKKHANSICIEFFYLDGASGLKVYPLYGETDYYIGYGTSTDAFFSNSNLEDLQEAFENMNLPNELVVQLLDDISKRLKNDSDLMSYLIKHQLTFKMLENGSIKLENDTISLKTLLEIQDLMKVKLEISVSNPEYSDFILSPVKEHHT